MSYRHITPGRKVWIKSFLFNWMGLIKEPASATPSGCPLMLLSEWRMKGQDERVRTFAPRLGPEYNSQTIEQWLRWSSLHKSHPAHMKVLELWCWETALSYELPEAHAPHLCWAGRFMSTVRLITQTQAVPDRVVSWGKEGTEFSYAQPTMNFLRDPMLRKGKLNRQYLLRSVFKYSFDFIHFFFPKVNNGEVNSSILLDTHLPGKQNTCCLVLSAHLQGDTNQPPFLLPFPQFFGKV